MRDVAFSCFFLFVVTDVTAAVTCVCCLLTQGCPSVPWKGEGNEESPPLVQHGEVNSLRECALVCGLAGMAVNQLDRGRGGYPTYAALGTFPAALPASAPAVYGADPRMGVREQPHGTPNIALQHQERGYLFEIGRIVFDSFLSAFVFDVTTQCHQKCASTHLANSASPISSDRLFFVGS